MPDRSHRRELDRLLYAALREAKALGHHWIGPEHFLLGMLATKQSPAAEVLHACGMEHDEFAAAWSSALASTDPPMDPPSQDELDSPEVNGGTYLLMGRAEGLAAGLGAATVAPEHVLIAYVWDRSDKLVWLCDVKRETVLDGLRALGVPVPEGPLPPLLPPQGRRVFVPYDHFDAIVEKLQGRLPAHSGFGLNWHPASSRAWVSANADVDLASLVKAVLDELGLEPVPQPERS